MEITVSKCYSVQLPLTRECFVFFSNGTTFSSSLWCWFECFRYPVRNPLFWVKYLIKSLIQLCGKKTFSSLKMNYLITATVYIFCVTGVTYFNFNPQRAEPWFLSVKIEHFNILKIHLCI